MALPAGNARAELRCDCTQVIETCSASVSLNDMDVAIESDSDACSRVDYLIDGQPFSALVVGGKASLSWQGQPLRDAQIVVENCRICADRNSALPFVEDTPEEGEDVEADGSAKALVKVMPNYPRNAWTNQVEGDVVVEFSVNQQGMVQNIKIVSSSSPIFLNSAIDAVSRFRYTPAQENGEPIMISGIRETFSFRLLGGTNPVVTSSSL
jgi:TonB family protein